MAHYVLKGAEYESAAKKSIDIKMFDFSKNIENLIL